MCERLKTGLENEEYQEMKARLFLNLGNVLARIWVGCIVCHLARWLV